RGGSKRPGSARSMTMWRARRTGWLPTCRSTALPGWQACSPAATWARVGGEPPWRGRCACWGARGLGRGWASTPGRWAVGAAYRDHLEAASGGAEVGSVMRFGVSTVRPSEDAAALGHRMSHAGVTRVVVTRSDGTLIGLFFAADVNS